MKTEMDAMRMDERQRTCWLLANRATLMVVGLVWLVVIAYEILVRSYVPTFMIIMVPVFAIVRYTAYKYYAAKN